MRHIAAGVVGQQRQQISELQFDKFLIPQSFLVWNIRFITQVSSCSDFPSDAVLWMKEVEMVDSLDEFKSSRSVARKKFPNSVNENIQNHHFKKKVSLEEQEAPKEDRFPRGRQIHDLRQLSSCWCS